MNESLYIITGASRGMGAAMADQVLESGHVLLAISRGSNEELTAKATRLAVPFEQWTRDLAEPLPVADDLESRLKRFEPDRFDDAILINNAGVVTRVGPIDECTNAELSAALRVGLEAALLLTASFLRATHGWRATSRGRTKVLNISSGLGRRAMAGSAAYCAAKAGMDHLSRAVALDETHRSGADGPAAKIVSLAPGVIDTDMQGQLRDADAKGFPDRETFVQLQRGGQLTSPHDAAARVLAFLRRADFGAEPVADIRQV